MRTITSEIKESTSRPIKLSRLLMDKTSAQCVDVLPKSVGNIVKTFDARRDKSVELVANEHDTHKMKSNDIIE